MKGCGNEAVSECRWDIPPPEIEQALVQIERTRRRLSAQPLLLIGPRGAGKAALLDRMLSDATAAGICTIRVEVDEKHSLREVLGPELRGALLQLSVAAIGDLSADLPSMLEAAGEAAAVAHTALAMFIGELHYVRDDELADLIGALHQCAQRSLPVTMIGTGLPSIRANVGNAKPYAERMFKFAEIPTNEPHRR